MYRILRLAIIALSSMVISNVLAKHMKSDYKAARYEANYPCDKVSDGFLLTRSCGKSTSPSCPFYPWDYNNNVFYKLLILMGIMTPPVSKAFKTKHIVPDVVATAPVEFIELSYPCGVTARLGNELTPTQVKDQPTVSFKAEPGAFYTLIMTDPDNYDGDEPVYREWHHWLVVNIPGKDADVNKGEVLSGYIGSGPPEGTGLHRYVYLLFKQPSKLVFDETRLDNKSINGRAGFSTKKFSEKHNLGAPVAGNFYLAQFDDYVPLLYKSLGA